MAVPEKKLNLELSYDPAIPTSAHSLQHLMFFLSFFIEGSLMSMKVVSDCSFNSYFPND